MSVISVNFATRPAVAADLDQVVVLVKQAREVLAAHTKPSFVVRAQFNPSRELATTFVQVGEYRLGITAGFYSTLRKRPLGEDIREWIARRDAAPRTIEIDVHADVEWLVDGTLADLGDFAHEYANPDVPSVEAAAEWIQQHCRRSPVDRVSAEEQEKWERRRVTMCNPEDRTKKVRVSLLDAVKIFGPMYGREISATTLVRTHDVPASDALAIEIAVKMILPRKKAT